MNFFKRSANVLLSPFKSRPSMEACEKYETSILSNIVAITKSLEKQINPETHPLVHTSIDVSVAVRLSEPAHVFINIYQILDKSSSEAIHSVIPLLGFDSWSTITQVNKPTTANSSRSTNSNPTTSAATSNPKNTQVEVFLRTILFKEYLIRLRKSIEAKDIPESSISSDTLLRLNSAFLLGSSSERIAEHLRLFKGPVKQYQFQDSLYELLEPEIEIWNSLFNVMSTRVPKRVSSLPKRFLSYSSNYLLDVLDLNTKCRCVYSWTDPKNDSGFKALPDDYSFPVEDILKSRRLYFQEAEIVPQLVMQSFLGATRMKYEEIKENRSLVRYGAAFIMGTILLDWLVCSI